jgi:hypothetical protein
MDFSPVRKALQVGSMDEALRNSLWNVLQVRVWDRFRKLDYGYASDPEGQVFMRLWSDFLKRPLDTLTWGPYQDLKVIRAYFLGCDWYRVYDFIEFIVEQRAITGLVSHCNSILEREGAGYRFIGEVLSPITSDAEIQAIEAATSNADAYQPTSDHLKTALQLLSDRTSPDYRNSIKESISAVEAACRIITGDPKATLGHAVKKLEDSGVELHPAFRDALSKMYGYTSDADGIRHALLEESTLDADDARFMLVMCSAFVNYLKAKAT